MSYLIKWKLEKLLKRRDFGEITRKQLQEITSKTHDMRETIKRDGASPRLGVSRYYTLYKVYGGASARGVASRRRQGRRSRRSF